MAEEITYFKGTHRVIAPSKTIEINQDKLKTAGITRIADITDLDRIGLPIYTAIRPTAEEGAISIYGGKGISKDHAKASAMMEGFERYSAEKQDCDETVIASLDEISDLGIRIGSQIKYAPNENQAEIYSVIIDDEELSISREMANNIFIRV